MLKTDPIESDPEIKRLIDAARDEALVELSDHPRFGQFGFRRTVWDTQKRILKIEYDIDWRTPAEMNPYVIFD